MDLIDKEKPDEAQFYSPSKIEASRKRMADLETAKNQDPAITVNLQAF